MPINLEKHASLIAKGYTYIHHDAEAYDRGNVESGPMITSWPETDEYLHPEGDHSLFITEKHIEQVDWK